MIHNKRMTATIEGEFVVFLIGMRINRPLHIHKWLPVAAAMPKMLAELYSQPELGLLSHEIWFSRTVVLVQYWRNMELLMNYAKSRNASHLPAWQAFNKSIGSDGSVGIWHETYNIKAGGYENVYVNMPPFGLGKAGNLTEVERRSQSAADRLNQNQKSIVYRSDM